ncbi:hypothetical protein F5148DRAFT_1215159 [Russula earlei]|uniref:Uncharacterized protein n=1 Tax=Russula earlei TaxID=71964 RepID=A0ACC0U3L4_9AGAM|nr:hypothetical protein F5148DRAFT_1215159 [Russula earlei]
MTSPAFLGTRPQRTRVPAHSRDSNTLRASVLDVALELGVGTSRAVENLIFSSFPEEDENVTTPPLTSVSATTSDESWPSVPAWNGIPTQFVLPVRKPSNLPPVGSGVQTVRSPSEDSHALNLSRPHQPRKLRKARKGGYESDGSYLSDNLRKTRDNKVQKKDSSSTFEGEFASDGGYLSDAAKGGADKKKEEKMGNKRPENLGPDPNKLNKMTRTPSDHGNLSDRGYPSEASVKKTKPFFRLRSRSPSATRKRMPNTTPPVPSLPSTPLLISPHSTRTSTPFSWLDGTNQNGGVPLRAAHSPVPPTLSERQDLTSSLPGKASSPLPLLNNVTSSARLLSIDTSTESLTSSPTSHETGGYTLSSARPRDQTPMSAPAALRPYGVRSTPSKRFGLSDVSFPISPSPSAGGVMVTSGKILSPPKTSSMAASRPRKSSPSPMPPSPVPHLRTASPISPPSDFRPFVSRNLSPIPPPLLLTHCTSPALRGTSPSLSKLSIVSSDFICPSPRPRFFEELPPPSPPPSGPLPEVPSPSLYQQPIPIVKRDRQSPFPLRSTFPVEESSRFIEPPMRMRQDAHQVRPAEVPAEQRMEIKPATKVDAVGYGVHGEVDDLMERVDLTPPSLDHNQSHEDAYGWQEDEPARSGIYLYAPSRVCGVKDIPTCPSPDALDDERNSSAFQDIPSSSTIMRGNAITSLADSDIYSYYFEELDRDGGDDERWSHASLIEDEHRRFEMLTRVIASADALYGPEKAPLVSKAEPC